MLVLIASILENFSISFHFSLTKREVGELLINIAPELEIMTVVPYKDREEGKKKQVADMFNMIYSIMF